MAACSEVREEDAALGGGDDDVGGLGVGRGPDGVLGDVGERAVPAGLLGGAALTSWAGCGHEDDSGLVESA